MDNLTTSQVEIYNHLADGKSVEQIAELIDGNTRIVNAQITRMINKGVKLPKAGDKKINESIFHKAPSMPVNHGGSVNDHISDVLNSSAPTLTSEQLAELTAEVGKTNADMHPMVMIGVVVQFVKLCGGRVHAHQVIEDVYAALRSFLKPENRPQ